MSTYERIRKLFIDNLELKEDALKPEAAIDSLGLDSLDKIEFMFEIFWPDHAHQYYFISTDALGSKGLVLTAKEKRKG